MEFTIASGDISSQSSACTIVGIYEDTGLTQAAKNLDQQSGGIISRLIERGDFKGKLEQSAWINDLPHTAIERLLLIGLGKQDAVDSIKFTTIVNTAATALVRSNASNATVCLSEVKMNDRDLLWKVEQIALAFGRQLYRFDQLKSQKADPLALEKIAIHVNSENAQQDCTRTLKIAEAIIQGMNLCRDLGNLPGNICTPSYIAEQSQQLAKTFKSIDCKVLDEKDMQKLGMGALLSVAAGSDQPAKLIVMHYNGGKNGEPPIALVGKGITFDSGGISLKPAACMDEMKFDMCGAASVLGTLRAVAELQLPINVIGVIASSENLPGGKATKPGDIVTSMSGQTIEILNTDAEGRLVLCDALTYVGKFAPKTVIDIATLTGSMVVALGLHISGMMTNHQPLADQLLAAGQQSNDTLWQMPMTDQYQCELDSNFADMANVGDRWGGAIIAACFLSRFTKDYQWAHLDIAGTAYFSGKAKGASGRPVALLTHYLIQQSK